MELCNVSVIVPAGKYVIGDPCYAVPDRLWDELLKSCDFFRTPIGQANGHKVLGFGTKWGDGCYRGTDGREYPVDAGLIGLVPIELVEDPLQHSDFIVTFSKPTLCTDHDNGALQFGHIIIDTDPADPEEEDDE
jgi:hypothetical protein